MKKLLPSIFFVTIFFVTTLVYMAFNGQELSASKAKKEIEKYSNFETVFQNSILKTTKGSEYKLKEQKNKIVILNFWASWCQPCLSEFATLKKLVEKYPKEKILVIGINNDEEDQLKNITKVEKNLGLNFESVIDVGSQLTSKFFISAIPASITFYNGKVIHYVNKEFNFMDDSFVEKLDNYLKKSD